MSRAYLPPASWSDQPTLEGDEAKHLAQVLRAQKNDQITVFDGHGNHARATILSVSRQRIELALEPTQKQRSSRPEITLIQAIPKGKNMDWIIQKAVELGVSRIHPLITRHTIVSPGGGKVEKWRRTALEACKQCAQFTIPGIEEPLNFEQWLSSHPPTELNIIASLAENPQNFRKTLADHPDLQSISILIGPEGDFSPEETDAALKSGFIPVTLGNLVLRVETAALFCLSAIRFQYQ